MTIEEIYENARRKLDKSEITIGEFAEIVDVEVGQSRWIPVSERLPKTNDIYLVSMHSYGLPTRDIDGFIQQTDRKWEVYGKKVIAWMPLPKPYKAESEEENERNSKCNPQYNIPIF